MLRTWLGTLFKECTRTLVHDYERRAMMVPGLSCQLKWRGVHWYSMSKQSGRCRTLLAAYRRLYRAGSGRPNPPGQVALN